MKLHIMTYQYEDSNKVYISNGVRDKWFNLTPASYQRLAALVDRFMTTRNGYFRPNLSRFGWIYWE